MKQEKYISVCLCMNTEQGSGVERATTFTDVSDSVQPPQSLIPLTNVGDWEWWWVKEKKGEGWKRMFWGWNVLVWNRRIGSEGNK